LKITIPSDWRIVWNNLALPENKMTIIESLFCAVYKTVVISMDYGSYKNRPCYSFSLQIGKSPEIAFESTTQLTRTEALTKLQYWLDEVPRRPDLPAEFVLSWTTWTENMSWENYYHYLAEVWKGSANRAREYLTLFLETAETWSAIESHCFLHFLYDQVARVKTPPFAEEFERDFFRPILDQWMNNEPNNPLPWLYAGYFGDQPFLLEQAHQIDPEDQEILWALVEVAVTHYQKSSTLFTEERGYLELADRCCNQMHNTTQASVWKKEIQLILKNAP
jgi:hypothetical protein